MWLNVYGCEANSHFYHFQNLKCREIPIVQLYIIYTDEDSGELVTRLINKEFVDRGAAQWVEHSSGHCVHWFLHSALKNVQPIEQLLYLQALCLSILSLAHRSLRLYKRCTITVQL